MELNSAQVNIRDLVAQVKSGQINKKDAFKELHHILKSSGGEVDDGEEEASISLAGTEDDDGSNSTGRISQEDRRLLINKLIEQKRQARADAESEVKSAHGNNDQQEEYEDYGGDEYYSGPEWIGSNPPSSQRPHSASSGRSNSGYEMNDSSYFTRRSVDDSGLGHDSRSNRIAQTEAAIRHEMFKDCTFRPKIKDLPKSYGTQKESDGDFYNRVTRWQKEKVASASRRKNIQDESDILNCTFQPKINRNSLRAVSEIRGDFEESTSDRLFKNHELSILQRSKYIEEELARERDVETEECTFAPNTSASNTDKFRQVRAKVSANPKKRINANLHHPEKKECTFTPLVKGVGKHMNSAQVYISTNVVDRLTKPLVQTTEEVSETKLGDGPVLDMASFMGALNQSGGTTASLRTPGKDMSVTLNASKGGKTPNKVLDQKSLQNFLGRQEQSAIRREKNIDKSKHSIVPNFQPQLCKKSMELSSRNNQGDFLERVERDVLRRADHEIRAAVIPDEACTFQPSITHKSEKLRSRTVYEMSRGDQMKRVTANRMMRMRSDQEELQEMTFKPQISKKAQAAPAQKVSLSRDTTKFLELQRDKAEKREADRLAILANREKAEIDECTFAPATKDCPAYVRRIAKSMAVVRSTRAQSEIETKEAKPTWK